MTKVAEQCAPALLITGRTRSGKTTMAKALGEQLGWPYFSFSTYIRAEAHRRGVPDQRRPLQDLAAQLIEELGWDEFCRQMLAEAGFDQSKAPFIIEGARHVETVAALRRILEPAPVFLIYLDVSDQERNRRLAQEGLDPTTGSEWEEHSTEREVLELLPAEAELIIDADRPLEEAANTAARFLKARQKLAQRPD